MFVLYLSFLFRILLLVQWVINTVTFFEWDGWWLASNRKCLLKDRHLALGNVFILFLCIFQDIASISSYLFFFLSCILLVSFSFPFLVLVVPLSLPCLNFESWYLYSVFSDYNFFDTSIPHSFPSHILTFSIFSFFIPYPYQNFYQNFLYSALGDEIFPRLYKTPTLFLQTFKGFFRAIFKAKKASVPKCPIFLNISAMV